MKRYLLFLVVLLSFYFNCNRVEAKSIPSRKEKGCAGLDHNRFRYYSPQTGAYLSKDPIGLLGNNPNSYAYVYDSNSEVDPWGLLDQDIFDSFFTLENHNRSPRGNKVPNLDLDKAEGWKWYGEAYRNKKTVALGDLSDTRVLIGNPDYHVLNSNRWSLGVNDAWLHGVMESGAPIKLVTDPNKVDLTQELTRGKYKGETVETVFARELRILEENGYTKLEKDGKIHMVKYD